jgi:phosphodiesterase/alkaline phosphatase D-like protein
MKQRSMAVMGRVTSGPTCADGVVIAMVRTRHYPELVVSAANSTVAGQSMEAYCHIGDTVYLRGVYRDRGCLSYLAVREVAT